MLPSLLLLRRSTLSFQLLLRFADHFRAVGQFPRLDVPRSSVDEVEEVQIVDIDIDGPCHLIGTGLDMESAGSHLLFHGASVFDDDAPGIVPGLTIGSDRRTLDGQFGYRTETMLVRFPEDLLFVEVELIQVILHPTECEGEKAGRQVGGNANGLIAFALGIVLEHDTDARVGTEAIRQFLTLRMHMGVVLNRRGLQLVRKLAEFLVRHVDCDLILNTILFHLAFPHFQFS